MMQQYFLPMTALARLLDLHCDLYRADDTGKRSVPNLCRLSRRARSQARTLALIRTCSVHVLQYRRKQTDGDFHH